MDFLANPAGWLIAGAVIMLAELVIPGGVVFFLGAACVVVATALWLGLVTTWVGALTLFFISSLVLVIALRFVVTRFAEGDSSVSNTEEILDEVDELVDVVETIGPAEVVGKVDFRGTHWNAKSDGREIPAGATARIVSRENITFLVMPADALEKQLGDG